MNAQIVLENVGVRLPSRLLFNEVNWTLYEGMRVALAGRNGSGKSTLLRILAGVSESSEGKRNVVGGKKLRVGFLDQTLLENAVMQISHNKDKSLSPLKYIQSHLTVDEDDFFDPAEQEWEIKKILSGLGFSKEWIEAPMGQLSGGWLLRIFIAKALLEKPEVLLLDEPTNHLDLSSIQWLEEFLEKEYEGSLVLVTHDVALQKRVTDSLAILHGGKFYFRTHQRDYLTFRESLGDEKRVLEKNIEGIQKKIDECMEFVYKFRAKAQTAARAQHRLKMAEDMEVEKKELKDRLLRIEGFNYNLNFKFRLSGTGAKFPLSLKNISFKYKEEQPCILKNISLDIKRGQRIAIIGDNGAGKTTLLNVLGERLKPSEGDLLKGHAVETGYFGQHQLDELSLDNTIIDNLRSKAHGVSLEELRGWLGAFGFSGNDEIEKKAKVLSGGEKARLALLRILVTRVNLILLDEPTNHLDIETKDLLKKAIKDFEGTTLIVSHDREFISDVAERIIYLSSNHVLTDHIGDLNSFFEKYPELVRHFEGKAKPSQAPTAALGTAPLAKSAPKMSFEERKKLKNQVNSLDKKVSALELEMEQLNKQKGELQALAVDSSFAAKAGGEQQALMSQLAGVEAKLHQSMIDWERLSAELEVARNKMSES
ncbi:MAG: ABC transporter ATP-binding protein [Proteobacteria bacterium]|nr:ABC transporter ATP-binding protein [Pseudomonadota bacterium]